MFHSGRTFRKVLKIAAWTLMAFVLAIAATIMCFLRLVSADTLTFITNDAANKLLDAHVTVSNVAFSTRHSLPVLTVEVDSVVVLSSPMLRLDPGTRASLPQWGDTLFTLSHFRGGINVLALLKRKIDLYDVEFDEPEINLVALNDSVTNYYIYDHKADSASSSPIKMPEVAINRFSIKRPKPLRFHNAMTGNHFDLRLNDVDIVNGDKPGYSLSMGGDMASPMLSLYNTDKVNFGIDGHMGWKPESPTELVLNNFSLRANFINALVSARVDFGREIVVDDYSLELQRTKVENLLNLIPDSLQAKYGLTPGILHTENEISVNIVSHGPFNLNTDSVPNADLTLHLTPGALRYDKVDFSNVSGYLLAALRGNELDQSFIQLKDFNVKGQALNADINIVMRNIVSDPLIEGSIAGRGDLNKLPAQLTNSLNGYVSGSVKADIAFSGCRSMLSNNGFHKLNVDGDIDVDNLYYLSADTATMLMAHGACLKFGDLNRAKGDSLFTARLRVDSAAFLYTEYSVKGSDISLAMGVTKTGPLADSTVIVPMGGKLDIGRLGLTVLGDSIVVKLRDGHGLLTLNRFKDRPRQPQIGLGLNMANMSIGTPDTRFLLSHSDLNVKAVRIKVHGNSKEKRKSGRRHSNNGHRMSAEAVYDHARYVATHKPKKPYPRVHAEISPDSTEIISWGTSKFLRQLLTEWRLNGKITADRAALFTPLLPVRNRMANFNMKFNNDSILLENVKYKLGLSDVLLSGRISNLARSLTSRNYSQTLKLNFELKSDTIDVNELTVATMRGSAYAAAKATGKAGLSMDDMLADEDIDDARLEKEIGSMVENAPGGHAPLMVPRNIDAKLVVSADNVMYSDLHFRNVAGEVMVAQGAVNLHNIAASSDAGAMSLSALYSSADISNLNFGFGLNVDRFNIERFIKLVPAIDSVMPMLRDFSGIIDAEVAATCDIDQNMNINLPSLDAAVKITGDSLAFIDPETYKKIGKWLRFKDKQSNIIRHMNVELTVHDDLLQIYPFIFDLDRYRLGVEGYNDLSMNFNYHIAVLKSPLPFKFGVTIKGNPNKYKVRLGKARLNETEAAKSMGLVDTVRVNLLSQLENIFRRGALNSRFARLAISDKPLASGIDLDADTLTHADSVAYIREGLIPAPGHSLDDTDDGAVRELEAIKAANSDSESSPATKSDGTKHRQSWLKSLFHRSKD